MALAPNLACAGERPIPSSSAPAAAAWNSAAAPAGDVREELKPAFQGVLNRIVQTEHEQALVKINEIRQKTGEMLTSFEQT